MIFGSVITSFPGVAHDAPHGRELVGGVTAHLGVNSDRARGLCRATRPHGAYESGDDRRPIIDPLRAHRGPREATCSPLRGWGQRLRGLYGSLPEFHAPCDPIPRTHSPSGVRGRTGSLVGLLQPYRPQQ